MNVFNQFTVGLKKQEQLKVEFVESLTEFQLLKKKLKKSTNIFTWWNGEQIKTSVYFYVYINCCSTAVEPLLQIDCLKVCTRLYRCLNQTYTSLNIYYATFLFNLQQEIPFATTESVLWDRKEVRKADDEKDRQSFNIDMKEGIKVQKLYYLHADRKYYKGGCVKLKFGLELVMN